MPPVAQKAKINKYKELLESIPADEAKKLIGILGGYKELLNNMTSANVKFPDFVKSLSTDQQYLLGQAMGVNILFDPAGGSPLVGRNADFIIAEQ